MYKNCNALKSHKVLFHNYFDMFHQRTETYLFVFLKTLKKMPKMVKILRGPLLFFFK
jgi:hypothetical protein